MVVSGPTSSRTERSKALLSAAILEDRSNLHRYSWNPKVVGFSSERAQLSATVHPARPRAPV